MPRSSERTQRYLRRIKQEPEQKTTRHKQPKSTKRHNDIKNDLHRPAKKRKLEEAKISDQIEFKDEINYFHNINDAYCRCCFKIFTLNNDRVDISQNFFTTICEILQTDINLDFGSNWMCNRCRDTVMNFKDFREEIKFKQDQFLILLNTNQHEDLTEIQKLSELNADELTEQKSHLAEVTIKEEPQNKNIFIAQLPLVASPESENHFDETFHDQGSRFEETFHHDESPTGNPDTEVSNQPNLPPPTDELLVYHGKKKQCPDCKEWFDQLRIHKRVHKLKPVFRCADCDYRTEVMDELSEHFRLNEGCSKQRGRRKATCELCGKTTRDIFQHMNKVHQKVKNYFCDLCAYAGFDKKALSFHINNCHLPKNVQCSICDYKTINEYRLVLHMRNIHEEINEESMLHCPVEGCNKKFRIKSRVDHHVNQVHRKILKVKCDDEECKKMFFNKYQMRRHYSAVHGPRNIICEKCGSAYGCEKSLRSHLQQVHPDQFVYCQYCSEKFAVQKRLNDHIKRHHTREKNIRCLEPECNATFYDTHDRHLHMDRYHRGILYHCQVQGCNSTIIRRDTYRTHLTLYHKDLSNDQVKEIMKKMKEFSMQKRKEYDSKFAQPLRYIDGTTEDVLERNL